MSKSTKAQDVPGVFICLYGPSKAGKTVASAAAGATGAFIGSPSGLLSARKFLAIDTLNVLPAKTVPEATAAMRSLVNGKSQPSVVIDDFSLIVESTINEYEGTKGRAGMWSALTRDVLEIRDAAREATERGCIVIFNCHEQPPRTSSGKFVRGGPSLPGQLPEKFSGMVDVIGRAVYEPTAAPWKYQLYFEPQADYVCGDRLGVFPGRAPMNIAEGLRHAGYDVPYPKGLEWMPSVVEKLAAKVLDVGIGSWPGVLQPAFQKLQDEGGYAPAHIRWALQDALHRAVIQNHENIGIQESFSSSEEDDALFA